MKILIIMAGFFPGKKYGGPPVSVDNFCSLMKEEECFIVTQNHDKDELTAYSGIKAGTWIKRSNANIMYLTNEGYNKSSFEKVIKSIKPDVIYLQGLFQQCVVPCLQLAKKYNTKVLLAPRGELCAGAFKKKYKKIPYILCLRLLGLFKNVHFQSTSDEETVAVQKWIKADTTRIHYLTNIPSIPSREYVRKKKVAGMGRFVFLSRIHPKKNLLNAIRFFENVNGKATFDIYGPIEDEKYWDECLEEIKKLPHNISVNYCGLVSHNEVHEIFSKYDAFLFPTLSENFGHVIAESLVVGTPVIISDQTPWSDVYDYNAGWAINLELKEKFIEAINCIIDSKTIDFEKPSLYLNKKQQIVQLRNMYVDCFESIINIDKD